MPTRSHVSVRPMPSRRAATPRRCDREIGRDLESSRWPTAISRRAPGTSCPTTAPAVSRSRGSAARSTALCSSPSAVGGAGSLEVAPGKALVDTPGFPEAYKAEGRAGARFLEVLKETELDWTFLSPSAEFAPGERTGKFRLGENQLLVDATGKSRISMEDYAIAFVDEL